MGKYEWEVLMESGIVQKVMADNIDDAKDIAESTLNYGVDHAQAYREVGESVGDCIRMQQWFAY